MRASNTNRLFIFLFSLVVYSSASFATGESAGKTTHQKNTPPTEATSSASENTVRLAREKCDSLQKQLNEAESVSEMLSIATEAAAWNIENPNIETPESQHIAHLAKQLPVIFSSFQTLQSCPLANTAALFLESSFNRLGDCSSPPVGYFSYRMAPPKPKTAFTDGSSGMSKPHFDLDLSFQAAIKRNSTGIALEKFLSLYGAFAKPLKWDAIPSNWASLSSTEKLPLSKAIVKKLVENATLKNDAPKIDLNSITENWAADFIDRLLEQKKQKKLASDSAQIQSNIASVRTNTRGLNKSLKKLRDLRTKLEQRPNPIHEQTQIQKLIDQSRTNTEIRANPEYSGILSQLDSIPLNAGPQDPKTQKAKSNFLAWAKSTLGTAVSTKKEPSLFPLGVAESKQLEQKLSDFFDYQVQNKNPRIGAKDSFSKIFQTNFQKALKQQTFDNNKTMARTQYLTKSHADHLERAERQKLLGPLETPNPILGLVAFEDAAKNNQIITQKGKQDVDLALQLTQHKPVDESELSDARLDSALDMAVKGQLLALNEIQGHSEKSFFAGLTGSSIENEVVKHYDLAMFKTTAVAQALAEIPEAAETWCKEATRFAEAKMGELAPSGTIVMAGDDIRRLALSRAGTLMGGAVVTAQIANFAFKGANTVVRTGANILGRLNLPLMAATIAYSVADAREAEKLAHAATWSKVAFSSEGDIPLSPDHFFAIAKNQYQSAGISTLVLGANKILLGKLEKLGLNAGSTMASPTARAATVAGANLPLGIYGVQQTQLALDGYEKQIKELEKRLPNLDPGEQLQLDQLKQLRNSERGWHLANLALVALSPAGDIAQARTPMVTTNRGAIVSDPEVLRQLKVKDLTLDATSEGSDGRIKSATAKLIHSNGQEYEVRLTADDFGKTPEARKNTERALRLARREIQKNQTRNKLKLVNDAAKSDDKILVEGALDFLDQYESFITAQTRDPQKGRKARIDFEAEVQKNLRKAFDIEGVDLACKCKVLPLPACRGLKVADACGAPAQNPLESVDALAQLF
jgi:hypothetical protein